MIKVTINRSFPWGKQAYKGGDTAEVADVVGRQWIAAGLAKPANKAARDSLKTRLPGNVLKGLVPPVAQAASDAKAAAAKAKVDEAAKAKAAEETKEEKKPEHVVSAMAQDKAPGETKPYATRDLKSAKT